MKVVVLGGGVIGVTSAWYLARLGHEVELIDRQPGVAMETSFANAGQVSPGYSTPWAAPGLPVKAIGWMLRKHSPLLIRARLDIAMIRWMGQLLANCTEEAYERNKSRMLRLAEYSRDCLDDLRHETGITYDDGQAGLIQLFRTQAQLDHAADDMRILAAGGVPHELLDQAGVVRNEPGLAHSIHLLKGGLRLPGDQSGDAHLFTRRLADMAAAAGVRFRLGVSIERLLHGPDLIDGVQTSQGVVTGDAYLAATGVHTVKLLQPLGLRLPVYPVKGYSLTIPLTDASRAPTSTVNDETYKVAMTRLGDRIRVGGTAELAGYDLRLRPERRETLALSFGELFGGGDLDRATYWTGLRPNTPDGTPIVGSSGRYRNLWLNTGHGTLGWTMACGSGRLIADLISERRPNIEHEDLALSRYAA
ncbi:D-amino acid dehydrogenase [Lichenicola cladoniae]|uniref:D-amino acid dehydrogenase n=1 Tax=Lichenicola cladoniae TaxID=1484109 RepID=A0A6M8H6H8_9PROT|nr:D-amino acid dehydrogenase [Lichenicola cladoniae]NPD68522.1 D-amino acid dehydrogenase [Acetobacteraceae bacterium]QKE88991.1 D-amino acid dehydrogenase [Lichenicola cladoniae]